MHPSRMCPAYREVLAAVARNECQIVPSIYDRRFGPHATEHAFAFALENGQCPAPADLPGGRRRRRAGRARARGLITTPNRRTPVYQHHNPKIDRHAENAIVEFWIDPPCPSCRRVDCRNGRDVNRHGLDADPGARSDAD